MAIELKVGDGKLDKLQEYNLKKIADCGGIAIVMTPENEEGTMAFLSDIASEAKDIFKGNQLMQ